MMMTTTHDANCFLFLSCCRGLVGSLWLAPHGIEDADDALGVWVSRRWMQEWRMYMRQKTKKNVPKGREKKKK